MANVFDVLPELMGDEQTYISSLLKEMNENKARQFANAYRARRRDPQTIILVSLIGFLGIAGVQRFLVDQIGMGILYLLTAGLCFIGTIIDMVNYKKIAFEYNIIQAQQIAQVLK